jgi:hypothetical protein
MVFKFRLISNEQDDFIRDFEILADQTFFQLHLAIQGNLHFDKSQIASFFTCNGDWEKEQEITLFELSDEETAKVITMDNALIRDYMHDIHDKMIYVFDVFNERLFFIELVDILNKDPSKKYPVCCFEKGRPPHQILMDQLFGTGDFSDGALLDNNLDNEDFYSDGGLEELGFGTEFNEEDFPDED